jgi:hypothetical protein
VTNHSIVSTTVFSSGISAGRGVSTNLLGSPNSPTPQHFNSPTSQLSNSPTLQLSNSRSYDDSLTHS